MESLRCDGQHPQTPPFHSTSSAVVDYMQPGKTSPCDKEVYVKEQHKTKVGHLCTQCSCMRGSIILMKHSALHCRSCVLCIFYLNFTYRVIYLVCCSHVAPRSAI